MLQIIKEKERIEEIYYTYDFDRGDGSGFTFPCDEQGNIKLNENNTESYKFCMDNLKDFSWKGVRRHKCNYTEPAIAKCECGEEFELINQYMGACECPNCGQWYNLFGQELNSPQYWERDY